jgi:hypothetical protein
VFHTFILAGNIQQDTKVCRFIGQPRICLFSSLLIQSAVLSKSALQAFSPRLSQSWRRQNCSRPKVRSSMDSCQCWCDSRSRQFSIEAMQVAQWCWRRDNHTDTASDVRERIVIAKRSALRFSVHRQGATVQRYYTYSTIKNQFCVYVKTCLGCICWSPRRPGFIGDFFRFEDVPCD